jgi:hypothetical protein
MRGRERCSHRVALDKRTRRCRPQYHDGPLQSLSNLNVAPPAPTRRREISRARRTARDPQVPPTNPGAPLIARNARSEPKPGNRAQDYLALDTTSVNRASAFGDIPELRDAAAVEAA